MDHETVTTPPARLSADAPTIEGLLARLDALEARERGLHDLQRRIEGLELKVRLANVTPATSPHGTAAPGQLSATTLYADLDPAGQSQVLDLLARKRIAKLDHEPDHTERLSIYEGARRDLADGSATVAGVLA